MKIDVDMRGVGEPTDKMWRFIWKIEGVLGIKYDGPEEFKAASEWISDNVDEYFRQCVTINESPNFDAYDYDYEDFGYDYDYYLFGN